MSDTKKPLIQSVERALDIFDLLLAQKAPMRSVDIASALKLNSNTANNLIRTIYRRGYLSQSEDGRYSLGYACALLAEEADVWAGWREAALGVMRTLSEKTGDSSFLGGERGGRLECIAQTQGTGVVMVVEKQAWLELFHCTASGKVLLSMMPPEKVERIFKDGLQKFTEKTIVTRDGIYKVAKECREAGYALCRDEASDGVASIGVPVRSPDGKTAISLSQPFPSFFLESGQMDISRRVKLLNEAACDIEKIAREMGL